MGRARQPESTGAIGDPAVFQAVVILALKFIGALCVLSAFYVGPQVYPHLLDVYGGKYASPGVVYFWQGRTGTVLLYALVCVISVLIVFGAWVLWRDWREDRAWARQREQGKLPWE